MNELRKTVLVLGNNFPESHSSAAGAKMLQWLRFFKEHDFTIYYASTSPICPYSDDLSAWVADVFNVQVNDAQFNLLIEKINPGLVIYDQFAVEEQFSWRIRAVNPATVHILETQDLHFLRYSREKKVGIENTIAKRELASILRCDLSSIISNFELNLLQTEFPFVADKIFYFPLCYKFDNESIIENNEHRKDFCFIGNFNHSPNRDAVIFLRGIWREIHRALPLTKCHIYGAYPTQQILEFHDEENGFLVHGRVNSVKEIFLKHKILLAPIRFGAGLKGKLLEAMQFGILSVSTEVGAEGISENINVWNGKIVTIEGFAKAAISVYGDDLNYSQFQSIGKEILENHFSYDLFNKRNSILIMSMLEDIKGFREKHFLTEIMNYHRQQSVRYLSKWIESKNKLGNS